MKKDKIPFLWSKTALKVLSIDKKMYSFSASGPIMLIAAWEKKGEDDLSTEDLVFAEASC